MKILNSKKRTYDDIIYKDIIARFGIKEIKSFRLLSNYIFSNFTKEISFNGLKNLLGFKSSVTVRDYVSFLEESYLVFELNKYDFSLKKKYAAGRKIYVIDNGMREQIAISSSEEDFWKIWFFLSSKKEIKKFTIFILFIVRFV